VFDPVTQNAAWRAPQQCTPPLSAPAGTRPCFDSTIGAVAVTGGKLDLTDNRLITTSPAGTWNGSAYSDVTGLLASGRNTGNWDGSGIVTSVASGEFTSLAIARASDIGISATAVWAGQTVSSTDTLVRYTYGGDANLDGKLNILDYVRVDQGLAAGLTGYTNGDFNYDGKVNILDYAPIIDSNIGTQGPPFPPAGGISQVTAVPEPLGMSVIAAVMLIAPRRRRSRRRDITR
jgi:hypothetical protein